MNPARARVRQEGHTGHPNVNEDHIGIQPSGQGKSTDFAVSFTGPRRRCEWNDTLCPPMSRATTLPTGTVTFLFTDIEGSTRLLRRIGAEAYAIALQEHRELLRATFARHDGMEIGTEGDSFFVVFESASEAATAAWEAQEALAAGPITVRMGLHTGNPHVVDGEYVGEPVHLAARIAGVAHGGQVLLSRDTSQLAGVTATDLGEHRLKDFEQAVAILQLGQRQFPPLRTISNTNLPRPASSFVGRDVELSGLVSILNDGARLVTLTGPGGSGKTRLAIEAASALVGTYGAGVFWVELAALRDPSLVTPTIAQTLGARDGLLRHIGEREMLLLLDNLEQLVDAAPELSALVEACPNLRLLITSRERLRIRGEVEYAVPAMADSDAVRLFCDRAGVEPDETIEALSRALDNLPLAIELAAARTSVLSPAEIMDRLSARLDLLQGGRDSDARQHTLRTTIDWSFDLLTSEEQSCLSRLSVFSGGCTLPAAEEVAGADIDIMQSLVDKSLILHDHDRLSMLSSIRTYAHECLEASGESEDLHRRHADYFMALSADAELNVLGMTPREWLDRLEHDHDNIRAALDWFESTDDIPSAMELGGRIWEFWCLRGHYAEGLRRLEYMLDLDPNPTMTRAKALTGAAHLARSVAGAGSTLRRRSEQALGLHRELGDPWGIAFAELEYAHVISADGDYASARPLFERSVERLREVGDEHRALQAVQGLAFATLELG